MPSTAAEVDSPGIFLLIDCVDFPDSSVANFQALQDSPAQSGCTDATACSTGVELVPAMSALTASFAAAQRLCLTLKVEDCVHYRSPPQAGPFEPPRTEFLFAVWFLE